jgi:hypothetical protein
VDEDGLDLVLQNIRAIVSGRQSGAAVKSDSVFIAEPTAWAPGYTPEGQTTWYASVLVHESLHCYQADAGYDTSWEMLSPEARNQLERPARAAQIVVLRKLAEVQAPAVAAETHLMINYLQGQQDSAQPPDYCKDSAAPRSW